MPPLPPEPWSDVRDALAYGPSSPQPTRGNEKQSEDCLFLNVWTPALRDGRKRPVMFYIHGGAYSNGSGSSPLYDGVRLCRRGDVVVVSVNHRLNAFGYLYLARFGGTEFADSGNTGQLDLDTRLAVGARQHRGIWRRCQQSHGVWSIGWRGEDRHA